MNKVASVSVTVSRHSRPGKKRTVIYIPIKERIRMLLFGQISINVDLTDDIIFTAKAVGVVQK